MGYEFFPSVVRQTEKNSDMSLFKIETALNGITCPKST
jgi:hypothetical protein